MNSKALVIFDMDDTLIASGHIWHGAEVRLFRHLGSEYSSHIAGLYKGMGAMDVGRTIFANLSHNNGITGDECGQLLRGWLIDGFSSDIPIMPGADELLNRLSADYQLTVASGSPPEAIESVLSRFGWDKLVKNFTSCEDVPRGKPHPDIFLEAARRFDANPADCIVIEDSLHGIRAAISAGMAGFVVPSSDDPAIVQEASRVFASLSEISPEIIEEYRNHEHQR